MKSKFIGWELANRCGVQPFVGTARKQITAFIRTVIGKSVIRTLTPIIFASGSSSDGILPFCFTGEAKIFTGFLAKPLRIVGSFPPGNITYWLLAPPIALIVWLGFASRISKGIVLRKGNFIFT